MTCGRELVGAVKARGSHVDRVGLPVMPVGKPRDRLRARRPAARYAVADRRSKRFPGHPVSHPPAETPTLTGITAHPFALPFSMPATILAAHHSLFAVPNLAEWNA